jgi:hypothetical protein
MKIIQFASLLALAISVVGGCVLISGQFFIDWQLANINVQQDSLIPYIIDLNEDEDYVDNREHLEGLADLALVGFVTNNASEPVEITVYITPAITGFTTKAQLIASGQATQLWGEFPLDANEKNRKIEWDESAGLLKDEGFKILLNEVTGDGSFTLYIMGASPNFDLSTTSNWLLITVDASG